MEKTLKNKRGKRKSGGEKRIKSRGGGLGKGEPFVEELNTNSYLNFKPNLDNGKQERLEF